MKKFVSFLLALMMLGSLAACNGLDLNLFQKSGSKEGYIGDTMSTYWFDFTIEDAYSCAEYDGYTAREGYQLVVAEMTLKNTFGQSVDMWDTDFMILWDDPDEDNRVDFTVPVYSEEQFPEEYSLGINKSRSGLLIYEVPEEFRDFAIVFQEVYEDEKDPTNEDGIDGDAFFVSFTAEEK